MAGRSNTEILPEGVPVNGAPGEHKACWVWRKGVGEDGKGGGRGREREGSEREKREERGVEERGRGEPSNRWVWLSGVGNIS